MNADTPILQLCMMFTVLLLSLVVLFAVGRWVWKKKPTRGTAVSGSGELLPLVSTPRSPQPASKDGIAMITTSGNGPATAMEWVRAIGTTIAFSVSLVVMWFW
ncbi:hypothetical protein H257_14460 [Aphanomyces astaci]|uniref:Uncharacterized protein n=1 Tax=Aphanomyces astaci TaxID=112090 RepID=W4FQS1_APHAT|nr:hypothetical protein H257_14460 [Aphanomyces astaci]ETV69845.1 hypothetical protein H257_14460 [Aphanomyces astaci]KAF0746934.1 hypothetical protein AaE_007936 [Aphanomyces astaci]|eukprot:XP_009840583.1 hypothetical protein H257_14460 [Aphanomyces astaci]